MIKMLPFGFLDAGITFVFRVYPSNVPVYNIPGSVGTSIVAVVTGFQHSYLDLLRLQALM